MGLTCVNVDCLDKYEQTCNVHRPLNAGTKHVLMDVDITSDYKNCSGHMPDALSHAVNQIIFYSCRFLGGFFKKRGVLIDEVDGRNEEAGGRFRAVRQPPLQNVLQVVRPVNCVGPRGLVLVPQLVGEDDGLLDERLVALVERPVRNPFDAMTVSAWFLMWLPSAPGRGCA